MQVLEAPRHSCTGCGSCCQGAVVHLLGDEAERMRGFAAQLGLPEPVDGAELRRVGGDCVFLAEDRRCRIHATFGGAEKPMVCRQFPLVTLETESGPRAGVDPASPGWWWSREDGPPTPTTGPWAMPRPSEYRPDQQRVESMLLAACSQEGATLAQLLAVSCGAPDAPPGLPPGFATRWIQALRAAPLRALLERPEVGPDHRKWMLRVLDAADTWDLQSPPPWPVLRPEDERRAIRMIREMVFLRLCSRIPLVQATALLLAGGAVVCAWTDPAPASFSLHFSTWCRMLRAGPFWQGLAPSPQALQALAGT